ncbi:DUF2199 domain-containing protein [Streptomyces nondiastaticus]|uniref:DUF2199 domain-containing protein n=1 Tax=Streptomyces nondiastaticus TaxID=3154512 RepID=UPI0034291910
MTNDLGFTCSCHGARHAELPAYSPTTLNLKTNVHARPVGEHPFVEREPTDHPLAVEQWTGMAWERVRTIAEAVLHPTGENS